MDDLYWQLVYVLNVSNGSLSATCHWLLGLLVWRTFAFTLLVFIFHKSWLVFSSHSFDLFLFSIKTCITHVVVGGDYCVWKKNSKKTLCTLKTEANCIHYQQNFARTKNLASPALHLLAPASQEMHPGARPPSPAKVLMWSDARPKTQRSDITNLNMVGCHIWRVSYKNACITVGFKMFEFEIISIPPA